MKKCIACGMPMEKTSDYALGDESKTYCKYCANEDGSMQSFEAKKESLIQFMMKTQGVARVVAQEAVLIDMAKLPAWKDLV